MLLIIITMMMIIMIITITMMMIIIIKQTILIATYGGHIHPMDAYNVFGFCQLPLGPESIKHITFLLGCHFIHLGGNWQIYILPKGRQCPSRDANREQCYPQSGDN